jgi:hypothetical protein
MCRVGPKGKVVIQKYVVTVLALLLTSCPNISVDNTACTPACEGDTPVSCKDGQAIKGLPCGVGTRCQDGVCVLDGDASSPVDVTDDTTAPDTHTTDTTKPDTMTPDTVTVDTHVPDSGPCIPQCDPYLPCGDDGCGNLCSGIKCPEKCSDGDASLLIKVSIYDAVLACSQETTQNQYQQCLLATGLSSDCTNCFVLVLLCNFACTQKCGGDPNCVAGCFADNCVEFFNVCTGIPPDACADNKKCQKLDLVCNLQDCMHLGKCIVPKTCGLADPAQCGCDNVTYPNKCERQAAGVGLKSLGVCEAKM